MSTPPKSQYITLKYLPDDTNHVYISELATYHAIAPYQSQTCFATYLICGEVLAPQTRYSQAYTEDVDMEGATDEDLEYDDDEGDDVPQTTIMLVNERDFESMSLLMSMHLVPKSLTRFQVTVCTYRLDPCLQSGSCPYPRMCFDTLLDFRVLCFVA